MRRGPDAWAAVADGTQAAHVCKVCLVANMAAMQWGCDVTALAAVTAMAVRWCPRPMRASDGTAGVLGTCARVPMPFQPLATPQCQLQLRHTAARPAASVVRHVQPWSCALLITRVRMSPCDAAHHLATYTPRSGSRPFVWGPGVQRRPLALGIYPPGRGPFRPSSTAQQAPAEGK